MHSSWRYCLLLLGFVGLVGCKAADSGSSSTTTTAASNTPLVESSITIDGYVTDWASVTTQMKDPQGDQDGDTSQDLILLKTSLTGSYLMLYLQLSGDAAFPHTSGETSYYGAKIISYQAAACTKGNKIDGYQLAHLWASSSDIGASFDSYSAKGALTTEKAIQVSSVGVNLEFAIPLSSLPSDAVAISFTPMVWSKLGTTKTYLDLDSDTNCFGL